MGRTESCLVMVYIFQMSGQNEHTGNWLKTTGFFKVTTFNDTIDIGKEVVLAKD